MAVGAVSLLQPFNLIGPIIVFLVFVQGQFRLHIYATFGLKLNCKKIKKIKKVTTFCIIGHTNTNKIKFKKSHKSVQFLLTVMFYYLNQTPWLIKVFLVPHVCDGLLNSNCSTHHKLYLTVFKIAFFLLRVTVQLGVTRSA